METSQYFVIWNHGFRYLHEIMNIIRNHPAIKITRVFRRTVKLNNFIKHIYKLDKSSYRHIDAKSKYLQSIKPEIFVIFVKDIDTIYKTRSNSNHRYSYHETFLKWHIRLLFNPRGSGPKINITKRLIDNVSIQRDWPKFVTHNHVIHSSDIEEETQLIIDYFDLGKTWFNTSGNEHINHKKRVIKVHANQLVVNTTYKDHMDIKDTPHYKYLLGDYMTEYDKYIMKHFGTVITCDNLSGAYDKLIEKFDYGRVIDGQPSYIVCVLDKRLKKYVVQDGVHRLSILVKNNITNFPVYELIE